MSGAKTKDDDVEIALSLIKLRDHYDENTGSTDRDEATNYKLLDEDMHPDTLKQALQIILKNRGVLMDNHQMASVTLAKLEGTPRPRGAPRGEALMRVKSELSFEKRQIQGCLRLYSRFEERAKFILDLQASGPNHQTKEYHAACQEIREINTRIVNGLVIQP
jgi:hypothetical protein